MEALPGKPTSLWIETGPEQGFSALRSDLDVDVAIVGGGMVGITTAALLQRAGRRVAVVDRGRIGRMTTGKSTAKVTSQHGLIYEHLTRNFGEDNARLYADANQTAVAAIGDLAREHGVDCDFETKAAYCYAPESTGTRQIEAEAEAARRVGLPASYTAEAGLPFPIAGAVRFDNQAQFHPMKYLLGLATAIEGEGCRIFENTCVQDVEDGKPCIVTTDHGRITAREVVVATNLPVVSGGAYFAKAFPRAHLVLAASIDADKAPDGMFISTGHATHSFRVARGPSGPILLVVGPSFKTGHETDTAAMYRSLERFVHAHFEIRSIDYRWMNQDYNSMDGVPYVGRLTSRSEHVHVATGFSAWGITNGMVSAMLLSDAILDRPNPWAKLYDSQRLKPSASAKSFIKENVHVADDFVRDRLASFRAQDVEHLKPGEAAIVRTDDGKVAAYRDPEGRLHAVSPVCTHLNCYVRWNNAERSWDCPCHGSRFDHEGRVLYGPAVADLERKMVN